jgi:tetratricopeptide (TPR) repeat protein
VAGRPGRAGAVTTADAARRAAGQLADAIALYRRALADRERTQGSGHAAATATRQKLAEAFLAGGQAKAAVFHAAGKMASAVRLAEQTAAEYTQILGADHRDTLTACLNLAHAYYGVGRRSDAVRLLTDIIERCEQNLSAGDPLTAAARASRANITGTG